MDSTCVQSSCPHIVLGFDRLECVSGDVLILSEPSTVECVCYMSSYCWVADAVQF